MNGRRTTNLPRKKNEPLAQYRAQRCVVLRCKLQWNSDVLEETGLLTGHQEMLGWLGRG